MNLKLNNRKEGFTIIEVLIVLAIAGLILLIVFLAVPALQRNNRNTSRNNDASRISTLVTECLANRNGDIAACNSDAEIGFSQDDFSIIETVSINDASTTEFNAGAGTEGISVVVDFASRCVNSGEDKDSDPSRRKFTVSYELERSGGGFIPRCTGSE